MHLKFKTSMSGSRIIKPGEVVEMANAEAERHIANGSAVRADEIEVATFKAREKAVSEQRARLEKEKTAGAAETR